MRLATRPLLSVPLALAALLALTVLAACRGPQPDIRFYTLNPLAAPAAASAMTTASVGVGPVTIPLALDRPQIMTRTADNQLGMAEYNRWGGSLSGDILTTLTQDISLLLGSDEVVAYPWTRFITPDFRVPLEILRFDGALGKDVTLVATWAVHHKDEAAPRVVRKSTLVEPAPGPGYADLVAAHSRALAGLAREIAAELARQPAGN